LFKWVMNLPIPRICMESPILHGYATAIIGNGYDCRQSIQPWQFGHGEVKKTGLWKRNLPDLVPTDIVDGREPRIWKMPPSKDRGKLRSLFYTGIAEAMANQWGRL